MTIENAQLARGRLADRWPVEVALLGGARIAARARGVRPPGLSPQPIATMRSIGTRARSATCSGTLTSCTPWRRESRSFGSVISFM